MHKHSFLVDSHCHLDFPEFNQNLSDIVDRACEAGVKKMITICTKPTRLHETLEISENYEQVYYAVGIHPHNVVNEPALDLDFFMEATKNPKMVGIGESGLDYYYTEETKQKQKQSFSNHIHASQQFDLPLIVHSRNADKDMIQILTAEFENAPFNCVMHCYSSGKELAKRAIDLGFYLSFSGILTFKNASALREIFFMVPTDRILVETDAPYLSPEPFRGKRNEPAFVRKTAEFASSLLDMDYSAFAGLTSNNFFRLFPKAR